MKLYGSVTQLNNAAICQRYWWWKSVYKMPEGEVTDALKFGIEMHDACEHVVKYKEIPDVSNAMLFSLLEKAMPVYEKLIWPYQYSTEVEASFNLTKDISIWGKADVKVTIHDKGEDPYFVIYDHKGVSNPQYKKTEMQIKNDYQMNAYLKAFGNEGMVGHIFYEKYGEHNVDSLLVEIQKHKNQAIVKNMKQQAQVLLEIKKNFPGKECWKEALKGVPCTPASCKRIYGKPCPFSDICNNGIDAEKFEEFLNQSLGGNTLGKQSLLDMIKSQKAEKDKKIKEKAGVVEEVEEKVEEVEEETKEEVVEEKEKSKAKKSPFKKIIKGKADKPVQEKKPELKKTIFCIDSVPVANGKTIEMFSNIARRHIEDTDLMKGFDAGIKEAAIKLPNILEECLEYDYVMVTRSKIDAYLFGIMNTEGFDIIKGTI